MQDYLLIFLGTEAIIFILRCLKAKIFILKNCQPPTPTPRINCTSPNKKRDQFQPYPNSTDCHTKHIARLHGLWPSIVKETYLFIIYSSKIIFPELDAIICLSNKLKHCKINFEVGTSFFYTRTWHVIVKKLSGTRSAFLQ